MRRAIIVVNPVILATVIVSVELFDYAGDRHVGDNDRTIKRQLQSAMGKRTLTLLILRRSSTNRRKN